MADLFDFSVFPILETERLIMRAIREADAPEVFAIFGGAETCRYFLSQDAQPYRTVDEAKRYVIDWSIGCFNAKSGLRWALTLKGDDTLVGTAGYNYWSRGHNSGEIGYDLVRRLWGKA